MKFILYFFLFTYLLLAYSFLYSADESCAEKNTCQLAGLELLKTSIVEINTEKVKRDFTYPWQIWRNTSGSGSGVIISENKILTAAHVVDYAEEIYLRKPGSDELYDAEVIFVSDESDLAILTPNDKSFFLETTPVQLGELPNLGDEITTLGFPSGGTQLALTKGIVSRIDFDEYSHSGGENLVVQIDAAINPGASGGGAFINGKLSGISFQGLSGHGVENIGYIIPIPVIQQFFNDVKDGKVDGVPRLGITVQYMRNQQIRDFYDMNDNVSGILVLSSEIEHSERENAIIKDDVLLKIEDKPIGNDGKIDFISGDRIDLESLIKFKQIGDVIDVELLRDGRKKALEVVLTERSDSESPVIAHRFGYIPDYEIVGGLIFQELSDDYIDFAFNENNMPAWMRMAQSENYKSNNKYRYVLMTSLLPHQINRTYGGLEDERVVSVNGNIINNLNELREQLSNTLNKFHVIKFSETDYIAVFDKEELKISNEEIKDKYLY